MSEYLLYFNWKPKIGHTYELWRAGKRIGIGTYTDDPNHGLCFIDHSIFPVVVFFDVDFIKFIR